MIRFDPVGSYKRMIADHQCDLANFSLKDSADYTPITDQKLDKGVRQNEKRDAVRLP